MRTSAGREGPRARALCHSPGMQDGSGLWDRPARGALPRARQAGGQGARPARAARGVCKPERARSRRPVQGARPSRAVRGVCRAGEGPAQEPEVAEGAGGSRA